MPPADAQLAGVKALAAQAGAGPDARQALIASGAVPKLLTHLSSKTAAAASQSALALSLLAADPSTRPSNWAHRPALILALVQALKSGGPLTLARTLATLAAFVEHVPEAGAAVVAANGVVPILRLAQKNGGDGPVQDAAVSTLDAFSVREMGQYANAAGRFTGWMVERAYELLEPLIRGLSIGPPRAKLFCLRALRILSNRGDQRVVEALRRPGVTEILIGFAGGEDADSAATAIEALNSALVIGDEPVFGN
jgi:hypothetical protein